MWKALTIISTLLAIQGCDKNPCDDDVMAYAMAQNAVKQELKSSNPVKFSMFDMQNGIGATIDTYANEEEQNKNKCHFVAAGYLSFQNDLGLILQKPFTVGLYYDKSTEKWYETHAKIN